MNASELEPADRDPKVIRRTVIILFILMFVGGTAIWWKYTQQQARDQAGHRLGGGRIARRAGGRDGHGERDAVL